MALSEWDNSYLVCFIIWLIFVTIGLFVKKYSNRSVIKYNHAKYHGYTPFVKPYIFDKQATVIIISKINFSLNCDNEENDRHKIYSHGMTWSSCQWNVKFINDDIDDDNTNDENIITQSQMIQ